jgi:tRNA(adenine34) deaminase
MKIAIKLAENAASMGEFPVGAVVVSGDKIVGVGKNQKEKFNNSLYHAEILAIDNACKNLGSWRLMDCDIYVTLEPCAMCAGAILNSRIRNLIYSLDNPISGAAGSVVDIFEIPEQHKVNVFSGIIRHKYYCILNNFLNSKLNNRHSFAVQSPRSDYSSSFSS